MRFLPIDRLKAFTKHLGETRTSRIRYFQKGAYRRQAAARNIENTVIFAMQDFDYQNDLSDINDILTGVARANEGGDNPLRVKQLYAILQCLPIINTREVQLMTRLSPRQARRYVAAIRTALPYIERSLFVQKKTGAPDDL